MANFPSDSSRSGRDGTRRSLRDLMDGNGAGASFGSAASARRPPSDPWGGDPPASDEIENTSAEENESILAALRAEQGLAAEPEPTPEPEPVEDDPQAVAEMTEENERLRGIIAELRQLLDETTAKGNESSGERETEYAAMLEEKTEVIRSLYARIEELDGILGGGSSAPVETGDDGRADLSAMSDELERERCALEQERRRLEDDRRQLREDEESMMRQMREMELQMARERAELARQRNELQRLHSEIRHELELAQRDAAVNERLRMLHRGRQEAAEARAAEAAKQAPKPTKKSDQNSKKPPESGGGGMFRRFFGGGDK